MTVLQPVLLNHYRRKYFMSRDGRYRITIDSELHYRGVDRITNHFLRDEEQVGENVLELKYDREDDADADAITQFFKFRLSKNSKYVNGIKRVDIRYAGVRM